MKIAQENEEIDHLRPACVECTHRCNELHGDRDLEEEKFDPDRSWPHFGRKVTKLALHHSPTSALCIPPTFMEEYPHSVQKGKPITLEGPSGNQWKVGAAKRSVLHSGWRAFAHDHRLREGDQLHFRLKKPFYFVVDIFDSHGDVRRSARKATVTGKYAINAAAASQPATPALQLQNPSRKRKDMAELAAIGKGIMHNLVDRWKTPPSRRGISFNEPTTGLRFSETTKLWENHHDHVVTIDLDSDDEKAPARSSKLERLIEHMEEEEEENFITPKSKPIPATQVGEDPSHQETPNEPGEDDSEEEEEEQRVVPSNDPLRQFTSIFDTSSIETLETLMFKARKGKQPELSASDPLSREAQINISCDEDMVMVKEEEGEDETVHLIEHSELDSITPQAYSVVVEKKLDFTSLAEQPDSPKEVEGKQQDLEADKATMMQHGISDNHTNAHAAAADCESDKADANHVDSSQVKTLTSITAMSEMYESELAEDVKVTQKEKQMQDGFSFGLAPDNAVQFPVINGDRQTDSVHPLKQGLKQADSDHVDTPKQMETDEELHLTKSKNSDEAHNDLHVTKTEPEQEENPNMTVLLQNAKEKEKVVPSDLISNPEFTTPVKKENNIQARVAAPTYTNTCVLESKRSPVTQENREKALKAAQACARKIRNPNFVAVMKSSHVYTDFIMDIPGEFGKQAKLPVDEDVRVTLVCDEVPRTCKAIWVGSKDQIDSKGWMNFSRSHCLEEGDVCVFECFSTNRLVVHIFRVLKLKRPIVLDWTRHYKVLIDVGSQNAQGKAP